MLRKCSSSVVSILMLILPVMASANGFGINATRLIYPANAESISVSLRNTMQTLPYLVQSRVSRSSDGVRQPHSRSDPRYFVWSPVVLTKCVLWLSRLIYLKTVSQYFIFLLPLFQPVWHQNRIVSRVS